MSPEEINDNLGKIWELLRVNSNQLTALDTKVTGHIEDEEEWKPQMLALVSTWHQAKGILTFIKWCALIGGGIATFVAWFVKTFTWKI